jgi:DNA-binding transcriptional ArsR family regulator
VEQLLWHLLAGSRGGYNRRRIVEEVMRAPANAQQLSDRLGVDYRTARHHLDVLLENGVLVRRDGPAYGAKVAPSRLLLEHASTLEAISRRAAARQDGAPNRKRAPSGAAGGE